jgi:hypothetical protein
MSEIAWLCQLCVKGGPLAWEKMAIASLQQVVEKTRFTRNA